MEQYYLASEQRAFPAMWIEDPVEDLGRGNYRNPGASIAEYRPLSAEFRGFLDHTPDLADRTREHFRLIVEDLARRAPGREEERSPSESDERGGPEGLPIQEEGERPCAL